MMNGNQQEFKGSPKKYHPKGVDILYEDRDILVVNKTCGLLTVSTDKIRENTVYYLLNTYVQKGNNKSKRRVFIVHRLDRGTSGVLVFAKSRTAKRFLQDNWKKFNKTYYAVVEGFLPEKKGVISSYLAENRAYNMYSVSDPKKGKFAKTGYRVMRELEVFSLLEIDLLTGRKNQIRVHFADKGCPVVGDEKYGEKKPGIKRLALHAGIITIIHPHTKEKMIFETKMPTYFKFLLKGNKAGTK